MLAGLGVVAFFVGAVYLALTASSGLPGQSHRLVHAAFPTVGGLRVGDEVRKASVRIGQVSDITLDGDRALVTLQLDSDETVYRNATVAIESRSALGQNFVALAAGAPGAGDLADGQLIPTSHAHGPASLDDVLSTFDPKTRAATSSAIRELGGGLAGHGDELHAAVLNAPDLLRDLGTVSRAAAAPSTDLAGLLRSTEALASRFDGREQQLAELTDDVSITLSSLAVDDGRALGDTISQAPATLSQARTALVALQTPLSDLQRGMESLRPGARALGAATPNLRGALRESLVPLGKVASVAQQAQPAVAGLRDLLHDARPLAPRLEDLLASTHSPAAVLAPYAPEISRFFTWWSSANRFSDKSGNYLRIELLFRPESVAGASGLSDPLLHRNPYPAPGQAPRDRANSIVGSN
jgi:phospholipid/cholesterol/gamma-HCH transport system substrate-binding protein